MSLSAPEDQTGAQSAQAPPLSLLSSSPPPNKLRKISTACSECKQRKTKCTGGTPCEVCASRGTLCVYNVLGDQRRKIAHQETAHELKEAQENQARLRQLLGGILATIQVGGPQATDELLTTIRSDVNLSQLAAHVRNARRLDQTVDDVCRHINYTIDGGDGLPSLEYFLPPTENELAGPMRQPPTSS